MQSFHVESGGEDAQDIAQFLEERLYEHNSGKLNRYDGQLFAKVVRDASERIIGGAAGWTWADACEITQLWVGEEARGKGVGTALLEAAEEEAREKHCRIVLVKTYSFQAPAFYQARVYRIAQTTEDFPPGHRYHTLVKTL